MISTHTTLEIGYRRVVVVYLSTLAWQLLCRDRHLRAAQLMIRRYGERTLEKSAARADELSLVGDNDGVTRVYGWFTKGFDTPDLKEAKALPERLRHTSF